MSWFDIFQQPQEQWDVYPVLANVIKQMGWEPKLREYLANVPFGENIANQMVAPFGPMSMGVGGTLKAGNKLIYKKPVSGKETVIYKNPTQEQLMQVIEKTKKDFPDAVQGDPKVRFTLDKQGNKYAWPAGEATHDMVESFMKNKLGFEANQNGFF